MIDPSALSTDLYVGGTWRTGTGRIDVADPTVGAPFASAATASVADCLDAVDAAAAAQRQWAATAPRRRADVLRSCFELMHRERDAIADLIHRENGKARQEAAAEVRYAAEFFRWFSEEAVRVGGEIRTSPSGDKQIVVVPEPVGVSLLVTPWNFPAAMATRKIAPALAAGCACVLKPAPETPLTALVLADLVTRAGAPAGVLNVVLPEPPAEAVAAMLAHPAVRKLSFTGSTAVGRRLLAESAPHVLRTSMELGGNAPFLVLDDADLDVAVEAAMAAKMRNAGASCVAANRFLVHVSKMEAFTAELTAAMRRLHIGYEREPFADVGALVSATERDKMSEIVSALTASGGRVVTGGEPGAGAGWFFEPTIVTDVPADAPTLGREIFGPIAPITAYDDLDDAVEQANRTEAGLVAYVVGGDTGRAFSVARRLHVGMVAINRGVISDPAAPFGGVKHSGLGREGGREGIEEYLERKYVGVDW